MEPSRDHGLSDTDHTRFRELILRASGMEIPQARRRDVEIAVRRAQDETQSASTDKLYRLLTENPAGCPALETIVGALTVGETHFFRNRPQFDALAERVLPDLIERRHGDRRLRIWSAGCATGEEPYSLAIVLRRLLPILEGWNVNILATDIDRSALEAARRATYRPWSFREVPAGVEERWFNERPDGLEVRSEIRELVTFEYLNLVHDEYPSLRTNTNAIDLILCRNVLMYFGEETARRVVGRLHESLAEGGWLVVGHAEPSQEVFHDFEVVNFPGTVLYRKPEENRLPERTDQPRRITVLKAAVHRHVNAAGASEPKSPPPEDAEAAYALAKDAANRMEIDTAEHWLEVALKRSPFDARAHYLRGLISQEEGHPDVALEAYRRCVYVDPDFVLGHIALAGLFEQMGRSSRARPYLDNADRLLARCDAAELVPEVDGVTVGRLRELVAIHRALVDDVATAGARG